MLINLRGSHGSGKTYVSHRLIDEHAHEALIEPEYVQEKHFIKPNCHAIEGGLYILGRWKSGMDGIFPQTIVEEMIEYWAPKGHVIWENVMVSANVGRWAVLSHKLEPINHNIWAFFDTPLELSIERVMSRRQESAERGFNHRQEDSEVKLDVLAQHWRRCRRAAVRAYQDGIDVRWIDHTCAYEQVYDLLATEGDWNPPGGGSLYGAPELIPWQPTEEEIEYVLKTAILPWEPEDTVTKTSYVSAPRMKFSKNPDQEFGLAVKRWGAGYEDSEVFGHTVKSWEGYHNPQKIILPPAPKTVTMITTRRITQVETEELIGLGGEVQVWPSAS